MTQSARRTIAPFTKRGVYLGEHRVSRGAVRAGAFQSFVPGRGRLDRTFVNGSSTLRDSPLFAGKERYAYRCPI